jgi:ABC-type cobalamin/Fe3+-siderophores transport system ATPase subunit
MLKEEITLISLIVGNKGKGKTKYLLNMVNEKVKVASGNIVYLDKSTKNIHELSNKVRLINVLDYPIENCDEFIGFICGIISQDYDLEEMYLDSFLKVAHLESSELERVIDKLLKVSEKYNVSFTLSISEDETNLLAKFKPLIVVSL